MAIVVPPAQPSSRWQVLAPYVVQIVTAGFVLVQFCAFTLAAGYWGAGPSLGPPFWWGAALKCLPAHFWGYYFGHVVQDCLKYWRADKLAKSRRLLLCYGGIGLFVHLLWMATAVGTLFHSFSYTRRIYETIPLLVMWFLVINVPLQMALLALVIGSVQFRGFRKVQVSERLRL